MLRKKTENFFLFRWTTESLHDSKHSNNSQNEFEPTWNDILKKTSQFKPIIIKNSTTTFAKNHYCPTDPSLEKKFDKTNQTIISMHLMRPYGYLIKELNLLCRHMHIYHFLDLEQLQLPLLQQLHTSEPFLNLHSLSMKFLVLQNLRPSSNILELDK